jgi:2-polyprenyl-3-methyl-5-hydroxy-6-metoxy-1,4-benzoquinol methylase
MKTNRWSTRDGRMRALIDRVARAASLVYFALVSGPRGRGRPRPATDWDAQWQHGHWNHLVSEDELPRYAVIAGYIKAISPPPAVLDVGCGDGRLLAVLGGDSVCRYHGIDISGEAVVRGRARYGDHVTFEAADLTAWTSGSRFDVVVMNEVLYYIDDPLMTVERYQSLLERRGMMIISMFRHGNTRPIWRRLRRRFPLMDAAEVKNRLGEIIDIKILHTR